MIPFSELEKALARWKNRKQGGDATPLPIEAQGSIPRGAGGLPPPREQTGEIDLTDENVESYEESP
ncbi:MAG TPA: hypothetical protein VFH73_07465 [Polyangia bacterium]|nr:hypothetical protein [Polyangia bacterium]